MKYSKFVCLLFSLSFSLAAEPWVDTSNIFLRENIQRLADAGFIKTPVTTFPLMWHDIAQDMSNMELSRLTPSQTDAYFYINHQLKLAKKNLSKLEVNVSNERKRFTSFGDAFRDKNNISISNSFITNSVAAKLTSTYSNSPVDNDKTRFDGSYIAGFLGNWVVSIGMQDRWWGPGWDSNLSLTNNARPIPAVALTRKSAEPVNIPFTEINIPWTVTSFMGVMDDNRIIKDTLLWGFRLNFKPLENLEIGITRLAQWGGEGRPKNSSTFFNILTGKDNCGANGLDCGDNRSEEPGNQQAGYDLRYSFQLNNIPFALYGQYFAEDGDNSGESLSFLTEPKIQVGFDTHLQLFNTPTSIFIEYTDTYADCTDKDNSAIGNCFYEHHIYQTGMRYQQRTLGNLYDNDATSIVVGAMSNINSNTNVELKLRHLQLNNDNSDKDPVNPIIGNPLTKVAEDIYMLSAKVQHSYKNWRYTVGSDISKSTFESDMKNKSTASIFLNVEYYL